jgi:hypothetical protein
MSLTPEQDELLWQVPGEVNRNPVFAESAPLISISSSVSWIITSLSPTETINYTVLAREHAELISQGKTSLEIATWLWEKLNIASWKAWRFHGERKVLSTPTGEEMDRLREFTKKAHIRPWIQENGWSVNYPEYLHLDGYTQNTLFGQANMKKVNARLVEIATDWESMGTDYIQKADYLRKQFGLDTNGDLYKLTYDVSLIASGSLEGNDVHWLILNKLGAITTLLDASNSRLCFLT